MDSQEPTLRPLAFSHSLRKRRLVVSRLFALAAAALVLFAEPVPVSSVLGGVGLDVFAAGLIVYAVLGRLWCLIHIAGSKRKTLVTSGPYALSRNPLYFFSFFVGLGTVILTRLPILFVAFIVLFSVYYPFVILAEEGFLAERFPVEFERFRASVPRFIPKLSWRSAFGTREIPRSYRVDKLELELVHASWYLLLIPATLAVRELHARDLLPEFWSGALPF